MMWEQDVRALFFSLPLHADAFSSPRDWAGPWGLQVEAACSEPCFPGFQAQPFSAELFVHSMQLSKGFVPTGKNKQQKQLCVPHRSKLGNRNFFLQETVLPEWR